MFQYTVRYIRHTIFLYRFGQSFMFQFAAYIDILPMTNISRSISPPPEDYILLNSYLYVAIERLSYAYLCMYVT